MNWEAIGAIGEVVGALGVIATLLYLATQIKQSSAATRANIRQSLSEQQIDYINSRSTDPFLRASMEKIYSRVDLNEDQVFGVHSHCLAHIRLAENYFAQYKLGSMAEDDWVAMRNLIARQVSLAPYRRALDSIRGACNSSFVQEMDRIIQELEGDA